MQKKENKVDPFIRLQYIAFCRNYTPPEGGDYEALLNFAKNYLCLRKNLLFFDPIWKSYSDEAILIEYYSVRMHEDSEFRQEVETKVKGEGHTVEDQVDWILKREKEYNENREREIQEKIEEAKISFSPDDIKGTENE